MSVIAMADDRKMASQLKVSPTLVRVLADMVEEALRRDGVRLSATIESGSEISSNGEASA